MEPKKENMLEKYVKTENQHWNRHAFDMLCQILKRGDFASPELPLYTFCRAVEIVTSYCSTPLTAAEMMTEEIIQQGLTNEQNLLVFDTVLKYLHDSEFDEDGMEEVTELVQVFADRIRKNIKNSGLTKPLSADLRDSLKCLMKKELEHLSETLNELAPIQRLNILCKLMPFVLPKTDSVKHNFDESESTNIWF